MILSIFTYIVVYILCGYIVYISLVFSNHFPVACIVINFLSYLYRDNNRMNT